MNKTDIDKIREKLFSLAEPKYLDFMSPLLPTVRREHMIGVRMPILKKVAKDMLRLKSYDSFLSALPHDFYEEYAIHAYILCELSGAELTGRLEEFLPYVDNWGICDSLRPRDFSLRSAEKLEKIYEWLDFEHTYTVRFAIEMLMLHYLGDDFSIEMPAKIARLCGRDYYLDMMVAWYFATALAERYEEIIPFLEKRQLSVWVHNKAISKAVDSRRIAPVKKAYLKTLRIKSSSVTDEKNP